MLDEIQQRVLGVLIEKERTVPDTYPLTENALLSGCNQKSNRDPEMLLDQIEIGKALVELRDDSFLARVESGGRSTRYRHRAEERLSANRDELAVLCELLIRGPQAPGALKPRIARLGCEKRPDEIQAILDRLASRSPTPLVERLPKRPRERDHRYGHLLGPRPAPDREDHEDPDATATSPTPTPSESTSPSSALSSAPRAEPEAQWWRRLAALEQEVERLRQELAAVRDRGNGS